LGVTPPPVWVAVIDQLPWDKARLLLEPHPVRARAKAPTKSGKRANLEHRANVINPPGVHALRD
jgi:hypothetical protein